MADDIVHMYMGGRYLGPISRELLADQMEIADAIRPGIKAQLAECVERSDLYTRVVSHD